MIEIAPEGKYNVKVTDNGMVFDTNHFTSEELTVYNKKYSKSSHVRYARLKELLTTHSGSFTFDDFIIMSQDEHYGPYCSIWRVGGPEENERTLGAWVVKLPKEGAPVIFTKTANPDEPIGTRKLILDARFWEKYNNGDRVYMEK